MGRTVGFVLLVGAVLVVGAYTFLPPIAEAYVARKVQDRLGLAETPEVDLTSDPAPLMLFGEFSDGRVVLPSVAAGGVQPEEVAIDLDPFDVDVLGSASGGGLRTEEPVTGDLRVELSEAEVSRLASSGAASFPITGVDLKEGSAVVGSEVTVLGLQVPVGVEGGVEVQGGNLVFVPTRVEAFGATVPEDVAAQLLQGTSFSYPLGEQFRGAVITDVALHEDGAVLVGDLGTLPIGRGSVDPS